MEHWKKHTFLLLLLTQEQNPVPGCLQAKYVHLKSFEFILRGIRTIRDVRRRD